MKANGLIIAKPGFDAKTAAVKDQIFNSQHNSLKIWMAGHIDISVPAFDQTLGTGGQASTDVAHNLGYSPFYLVYFKLQDSTKLWLQDSLDATVLLGDFVNGFAYSNATNLHIAVQVTGNSLAAFTATAYYQIMIDKSYE